MKTTDDQRTESSEWWTGRTVRTFRGAMQRDRAARQPLCAEIDGCSKTQAAGQVEPRLKTPHHDLTTPMAMCPLVKSQRLVT